MLRVEDLRKGFGSGATRLEVLEGIDLEVKPGELVALMGPSGCGKSTLLNIIGGLLEADAGSIDLAEFHFGMDHPRNLVELRRHGVGWVFQDFHLLDHLSALDNVALALELSGLESSAAEEEARTALDRVGLGDRASHRPTELSGGQQQRVGIARALVKEPRILLADEPTGNLDSHSSEEILALLEALNRDDGLTLIIVTHEPDIASRAGRVLSMLDGEIVGDSRQGPARTA